MSAIIQLNSAREFTALWQQVHLRSPPPLHSLPSSGIDRRATTRTRMPQRTPVHKIHTHVSKQANAVAPALCFCLCFTNPPLHSPPSLERKREKKKKEAAQSPGDTDPHMISPQCIRQAGRGCSRRGNSVSVCSTEKREGKIGVRERGGGGGV